MAKILILDDQPIIRDMVMDALLDDGYQVIFINDAGLLDRKIDAETPDLVLLDRLANSFDAHLVMLDVKNKYPQLPVDIYFVNSLKSITTLMQKVRQTVIMGKYKQWRRLKTG